MRAREAGSAALVCVASWLALLVGAGNTGLQRSISQGPLSLLGEPVALVFAAGAACAVAFGAAFVAGSRAAGGAASGGGATPASRAAGRRALVRPGRLLGWVVAGDAMAGLVLAPLAVGELTPGHAPVVIAVVSLLGIQPAAAVVGALLGAAARGGRH